MFTKKHLINAVAAIGMMAGSAVATPAMAHPFVSVEFGIPAPIVEVRPAYPGPNYAWVAGHWQWTAYGWTWERGYWNYVAPVYVPPAPVVYRTGWGWWGHEGYRHEAYEQHEAYEHHEAREDHARDERRDGDGWRR